MLTPPAKIAISLTAATTTTLLRTLRRHRPTRPTRPIPPLPLTVAGMTAMQMSPVVAGTTTVGGMTVVRFPFFSLLFLPFLVLCLSDSSRPHPQQTAHPLLPAAGNTRTVPTSLPEAEALPAEATTALLPLLAVAMTLRGAEEEGAMSTPRR